MWYYGRMEKQKNGKITRRQLVVIVVLAAIAALAMFLRPPEAINIISADGRVRIHGAVPESVGAVTIVQSEDKGRSPELRIASIYTIEPIDAVLPAPVELSFAYENVVDYDPSDFVLAWWNVEAGRWEPVLSMIDSKSRTISAHIGVFGSWTILWEQNQ